MRTTYDDILEKHGYQRMEYGWKKHENFVTLFKGNKVQVWKPSKDYDQFSQKDYDTGIIQCTPEALDFLITQLYRP